MFERWTERARTVVVLAQEEAREMGHGYIGTEHLLLGLLREEDGIAGRVLASLGVECETTRDMIDGRGEPRTTQQIPFTPRCKKVCELSLREALALGNNYIGTEHVLLGLVRENEGVAARILRDLKVDGEAVRNEVIRLMTGARQGAKAPTPLPGVRLVLSTSEAQFLLDVIGARPVSEQMSGDLYRRLQAEIAKTGPKAA